MHALAGDHLEQVEDRLALAEAVPKHRDRAQLESRRAEIDEVRVDAVELAEEHAHPLRLRRHLELEELLDGRARRRARCSGSRRSRCAPGTSRTSSTSSAPSSSRSPCAGSRSTADVPTTFSPWRSTMRRSTPCVDGWFGPKLTWRSPRVAQLRRDVEDRRDALRDARALVDPPSCRATARHLRVLREADGLAADRVVLAQRVPVPVVRRMRIRSGSGGPRRRCPSGRTASRSCQSAVGHTEIDARHALAVVDPGLQPHARRRRP